MVHFVRGLLAAAVAISTAVLADDYLTPRQDGAAPLAARQVTGTSPSVSAADDTTVTVTANPSVVQTVTTLITLVSTIVVTKTTLTTATVTSSNVATATATEYVTSTVISKRWMIIGPAPETAAPEVTAAGSLDELDPVATVTGADWAEIDLVRRKLENLGLLAKRATVTATVPGTKTITVVSTITNTVVSTTSSEVSLVHD